MSDCVRVDVPDPGNPKKVDNMAYCTCGRRWCEARNVCTSTQFRRPGPSGTHVMAGARTGPAEGLSEAVFHEWAARWSDHSVQHDYFVVSQPSYTVQRDMTFQVEREIF